MARITITIPDNLQTQVLKLAKKEGGSISYTASRLMELGFLFLNIKAKNQEDISNKKLDDYCCKLIIQINEILKDLVINNYNFSSDKIARLTKETMLKYEELLE